MNINDIFQAVNDFVWGPIMLFFLVGTGVFLTVRLKFLPWRNLGYALASIFRKPEESKSKNDKEEGDISPFQSLMTALAGTIGTGNIVGVATAMVLGGPGAIVWMWISAVFGLSTKYSESVLSVKFRETNERGEKCGGPMYALKNGFKNKKLGAVIAFMFAFFGSLASLGTGNMTQANSISSAFQSTFNIPTWVTGIILTILCFLILLGGIKSIGKVCGVIVPFMAVLYFIGGLTVIGINYQNVPDGLRSIFSMAFSVRAVTGGVGGTIVASMMTAMRFGVARGVFSNESGLGTGAIAAAAAKTDHASRQGYINMTGTFIDTIIICSLTGLVIASSGILGQTGADGNIITGATLTIRSFESALGPAGGYVLTTGLALFAFSTAIGWAYYGEKCFEYIFKKHSIIVGYRVVYCGVTFLGATMALDTVWNFSEAMNGLMIIPNLICLIGLSGVIAKECFAYEKIKKEEKERRQLSRG